jgi:hypothetical protein
MKNLIKINEQDKTNKMEKINNMETTNDKNEKIHYEIRFVETDDGYRLEATGNKHALNRMGIGPNMLNRRRKRGHGAARGRRGPGRRNHGRAFRRHQMHHRRAAMTGHGDTRHNQGDFNNIA